jgi:hypothetical protein
VTAAPRHSGTPAPRHSGTLGLLYHMPFWQDAAGQLGDAARRFVRPRFGVDGYVSSVTALYDRLLSAKCLA